MCVYSKVNKNIKKVYTNIYVCLFKGNACDSYPCQNCGATFTCKRWGMWHRKSGRPFEVVYMGRGPYKCK